MENCLEKLKHRFIKYQDHEYNYLCVRSVDIYYCYIDINNKKTSFVQKNIEGNEKTFEFIKKNINLSLENYSSCKTVLLEGNIQGNIFYVYDILAKDDEELNLNYRIRYTLLRKIMTENFKINNCIKILKPYYNTNLEYIINDVIDTLPFKTNYIIMIKNFENYIIPIEDKIIIENDTNGSCKEDKNNINLNIKEIPSELIKILDVKRSNYTEIYIVNDNGEKSVAHIKDIKTSNYVKKLFETNQEIVSCKCKFDFFFKKWQIICI